MIKKLTQVLTRVGARMGTRSIIILIMATAVLTLSGAIGLVMLTKPASLPPQATLKKECASCHAEIYTAWHSGKHSDVQSQHAMSEGSNCAACHKDAQNISTGATTTTTQSSFQDFWVKEGMPNNCLECHATGYDKTTNKVKSDGIACEACHGVIPDDHPNATVSTNKAVENCRTCHTDERFDWGKWKDSLHFQNSISCVDCHNPHTTNLKTSGDSKDNASLLCGNCHKDLSKTSEHSTHANIGVTCVDCHLGAPKGNDDFHQIPDHDFKPKIETCNKCHANQMHAADASNAVIVADSEISSADTTSSTATVTTQKSPSPVGFVMVAVLVGVIGGTSLRKTVFQKKR